MSGVTLALLNSHIAQFEVADVGNIFGSVSKFVASFNQTAGSITIESIPADIRSVFRKPTPEATIPAELLRSQPLEPTGATAVPLPPESATAVASLLGSWEERVEGDQEIIRELIEGNDKK